MKAFNLKDAIGDELKRCVSTAERKYRTPKPGTCEAVLTELLKQIKSIDFRAKSGLPDEGKISRKIYVVVTVDEVLDVATANNWGLATRDGFIYIFNGEYWQPVGADDFKPFLAKAAMRMGVPVMESKYHMFKDELYKQFLSEANLQPPTRGNKVLINLTILR